MRQRSNEKNLNTNNSDIESVINDTSFLAPIRNSNISTKHLKDTSFDLYNDSIRRIQETPLDVTATTSAAAETPAEITRESSDLKIRKIRRN